MPTIQQATVTETKDLGYKKGYVQCTCGWHKDLGDGFNGYHIDVCPTCSHELATRIQRTVTTGRPGNYTIREGYFTYFVLSNGVHVQYHGVTFTSRCVSNIPA